MNILITHVYSKNNKGDAAILSAMISQVRKVFPKAQITIVTSEKITKSQTFDNCKLKNSFFYFAIYSSTNTITRMYNMISIITTTTLSALFFFLFSHHVTLGKNKNIHDVFSLYKQADLILPVGGGYINGRKNLQSTVGLILTLHAIIIGILLKKKTILYSQTIGPFSNSFQKYISSVVLRKTQGILVRENHSVKALKDLHITKPKIVKTVDAAFLFMPKNKQKRIPNTHKQLIGITVRKWLAPAKQAQYEEEMARFISFLLNKQYTVLLIPQVTAKDRNDDDRIIGKNIAKKLKYHKDLILINKHVSHYQIYSLYRQLDYLIGTRMHSIIFALTAHVPAIAIEYEYKTSGIMKDLGLMQYVIGIEDVTAEKLITLFNKLTTHKQTYKKQLIKTLKTYTKEAQNSMNIVKSIYLQNIHA